QLVKRPTMQVVALRATEPYPSTDTRQIFEGNAASGAFRFFDNLLADLVVHITRKACFLARQTTQDASSRASGLGLQSPTLAAATLADTKHIRTSERCAIARGGNLDDAHIDAKPLVRVKAVIFDDIAGLVQVPFAIAIDQIRFTLQRLKHLALTFATHKGDALATLHRPDIDLGLVQLPTQYAAVIGHASHTPKCALG